MPLTRMARHLQQRSTDGRRDLPLQQPRYNPCPPGVIRKGSATDAVLSLLEGRPGAWLTHAQILVLTRRSTKSVCWACLYLKSRGLVESTPDDTRNPRYRRYRAVRMQAQEIHR